MPAVINDPHSAWHSVLLADHAEGRRAVIVRLGPEVGKDASADNGGDRPFPARTVGGDKELEAVVRRMVRDEI